MPEILEDSWCWNGRPDRGTALSLKTKKGPTTVEPFFRKKIRIIVRRTYSFTPSTMRNFRTARFSTNCLFSSTIRMMLSGRK